MEKALAIFEKSTEGTKAVFIDQDTIECARLNMRTKKRVEKLQMEQLAYSQKRKKAAAEKARFKEYTAKTFAIVCGECAAVMALAWAGSAELIHPAIFIPASLFFLCAACVRLGAWIGWVNKQ